MFLKMADLNRFPGQEKGKVKIGGKTHKPANKNKHSKLGQKRLLERTQEDQVRDIR